MTREPFRDLAWRTWVCSEREEDTVMGVQGEVVHHGDRGAGIGRYGRPHFVEIVVGQRRLNAEGHVVSLGNDLAYRPASRLS